MTHAPADHDRRQPAQARLARRAEAALGALAARGRRARRGQARRRAPGAARPGARRHRHRHRRRADAPPFRHHVHREPRRRRLRSTGRPCASATATTPTCPVVVGPVARRQPGLRRATRASCAAQTDRTVKFTLPGPMTMVDTLYDDHYRSREKLALGVRRDPERGGARASTPPGVDVIQFDEPAFNVYFDEVRDWGVAALERAAQGLTCTTAVHICYGYGIKANIDWKKTLGSEWRQYEETFPLLARIDDRPGVARMRELARADRADRAARGQGRPGRRDRRRERDGSKRRRTSRRRSARRCAYVPAGAALPLHQLRHGAAAARRRARQARGAGRRRGAGAPGTRLTARSPACPVAGTTARKRGRARSPPAHASRSGRRRRHGPV